MILNEALSGNSFAPRVAKPVLITFDRLLVSRNAVRVASSVSIVRPSDIKSVAVMTKRI